MKSGITASEELLSDTSLRGLLAGIKDGKLVPIQTIPLASPDFESDLSTLDKLIKNSGAVYMVLRCYAGGLDLFVLIANVPDSAHVRLEMLVASTRLTLSRLRNLGRRYSQLRSRN